jgi:hypothetical protein
MDSLVREILMNEAVALTAMKELRIQQGSAVMTSARTFHRAILAASLMVTVASADPTLAPEAEQALARAAAKAMDVVPQSVTAKATAAPSGNPHDYSSMGPYWWPNPEKPDGLPYIRRDGEVNPETRGDRSDSPRLGRMAAAVEALAASWHHTRNETHARHAGVLLRTWFIDGATRMNPHLEYSQGIPGICDGRGIGLIDGVGFLKIPAAVEQLRGAPGWPADDERKMKLWFSAYLDWILTSKKGREAANAANNHGTWHDVQCVTYARFLGREDVARGILAKVAEKRIATHIAPDGSQPHEVARTKSWGYSVMNLTGLFRLARLAEGDGPDLWNFQGADGRGLRAAITYLARHMDGTTPWPHANLGKWDPSGALPLAAAASRVYPADTFPADLILKARKKAKADWRPAGSWP